MKINTIAASSTARRVASSSPSALAAQTKADQAHQTRARTIIDRPRPAHVRSRDRSAATWVTAKTNTRSHSSSTGVVRRSLTPGSIEPAAGGSPRPARHPQGGARGARTFRPLREAVRFAARDFVADAVVDETEAHVGTA